MKFLAVAEAGKIGAAAERLAIAQPALTRTIARLEARFGARLFERLPTGVRLTPLGETAVELARGLLREIDAAAEKFDAVIRGRTGSYRITASSMWMEAVLAPAVDAFSARLPGIELTLRTAPFGDGLQLLANGDSDLHCGGMDTDEPLPAFLRREYFLNITVGVVACEDHPLLAGTPTAADLADCPWIDYDAPPSAATVALADPDRPSSLDRLLDGLFHETGRRVSTVLRARAAGLYLMATGSWLAWLPLNFLERLTGPRLRPLPTRFGRQRFRTGFVARRSAEDLESFRLLERTVREVALERSA